MRSLPKYRRPYSTPVDVEVPAGSIWDFPGGKGLMLAWMAGLKPDPELTVSEWADQYRYLSTRSSSEPGPWRTKRTPYLKAIMDDLSAVSPIRRVVVMKGSQVGATELGNNWLGYVIHHVPGPMLLVSPTIEMAKRNSRTRIDPMIDAAPALKQLVGDARTRDKSNAILMKEFPGGVVVLTGANSPVGLKSMPARYLFLDEADAYPGDVDGEGDPISLAERAARTFQRRKVFINSTPTIRGASRIEREYLMSDKRRFFVPCPACGAYQTLEFAQLRWPKGDPRKARYECAHCHASLGDEHKTAMLEAGEWRATAVGADPKTAGYHLSALYSPVGWLSWVEIAHAWEAAQGNVEKLKTFVNTILGETWQEQGEAPPWEALYDRREAYTFRVVPWGGLFITAGIDIQDDRIEVRVWAWGRRKESWLVDIRILTGSTSEAEVWDALSDLVEERWQHASGLRFQLSKVGIDSGHLATEVSTWARKQAKSLVLVVKGVERAPAMVGAPAKITRDARGKPIQRGVWVWPVSTSTIKSETYRWLGLRRPTDEEAEQGHRIPDGYVHLPMEAGEVELRQLTAEQLMKVRDRKGFTKLEWTLPSGARNEALDCRVYARAAAHSYGLDIFDEVAWRELEAPIPKREDEDEEERARRHAVVAPRDVNPSGAAAGSAGEGSARAPPPPASPAAERPGKGWVNRVNRRPGGWLNR